VKQTDLEKGKEFIIEKLNARVKDINKDICVYFRT
jgi:hypothetical protein